MGKRFALGEFVKWHDHYHNKIETGNIISIDHAKGTMSIFTGVIPTATGGCTCITTAQKRNRKWYALREQRGFLEPIRRVRPHYNPEIGEIHRKQAIQRLEQLLGYAL